MSSGDELRTQEEARAAGGRERGAPPDWNVVVSTRERGYRRARRLLGELGDVRRTAFHNVLVVTVSDIREFLVRFEQLVAGDPRVLEDVSRAAPAEATFDFHSAQEFEAGAREIVLPWAPRLAGKSFHVRLHRRGLKGRITSPDEERFLDRVLLEALEQAGTPASITFADPDAVIDIETVGARAGVSLWTREELVRYPFLRVD